MLKKLPFTFLREYLFWLAFFAVCRTVFLLYNLDELKGIGFGEILSAYVHALYLDTSMASYLLAVPFLLFFLAYAFSRNIFLRINTVYSVIIIALLSLITVSELEIYNEWGVKLNVKALKFLEHPAEVLNTVRTSFLVFGLLGAAALIFAGIYLRKKMCVREVVPEGTRVKNIVNVIVFFAVTPVLLVLGLRGGLQEIPIQQSDAYFSKHNILNLTAVNSGWNLGQSVFENKKVMGENPFNYYPMEEAKRTVAEIYRTEKDTTVSILRASRPNIVLCILEGWSGDCFKEMGGYDSITPGMQKLIRDGVFFENIYASGDLSDQGMSCIFSGFPAQPMSLSITTQPNKYVHLPCINTELKQAGYHTSYLFGGQLSYGNIKAYMYYNNFDRILEGKDFEASVPQGKLGVHDEYMLARELKELRTEKEPFFSACFTLSSHSPFDEPYKEKLHWGGDERRYINSVSYADSAIYDFVQKAKKEKWYDNTLFVFVSDHSHRSPKQWDNHRPEYRRIPMLFYGNVIKDEYKGHRVKKLASQIDLAATLLSQLNISPKRFKWSKNIFNPYSPGFAYYEAYDGLGWVREGMENVRGELEDVRNGPYVKKEFPYIVYSHAGNNIPFENTADAQQRTRLEKEGKSFLEVMFQEYTDY